MDNPHACAPRAASQSLLFLTVMSRPECDLGCRARGGSGFKVVVLVGRIGSYT